jgi:hypothetical protein
MIHLAGQYSSDIPNTVVIVLQGIIAVCQTIIIVITRKHSR